MNIAHTIAPARHRLVQEALAGVDFALAAPADAGELASLFEAFFAEADYKSRGIVYSRERAKAWLERVIKSGSCPHIIARTHGYDGKIIGVTSYSLDESFCERPVAVLGTLYVVPEHRRSAVGRILVAVSTEAAIGDGACAFHAPIASGMAEMKTLKNLFTRAGFVEIGTILGRGL
jgi:GNAT superfamily N-acetyltransferase